MIVNRLSHVSLFSISQILWKAVWLKYRSSFLWGLVNWTLKQIAYFRFFNFDFLIAFNYYFLQTLKEITDFENRVGGILLDSSVKDSNHHFSIRNSHTVSPHYTEVFAKKSLLVMRMLEIRIGAQLLIQVHYYNMIHN